MKKKIKTNNIFALFFLLLCCTFKSYSQDGDEADNNYYTEPIRFINKVKSFTQLTYKTEDIFGELVKDPELLENLKFSDLTFTRTLYKKKSC